NYRLNKNEKVYNYTHTAIQKGIAIFFDVSTDYLIGLEDENGSKNTNAYNSIVNSTITNSFNNNKKT
ncbi:MAG: hypothetical protein LBS99_01170, partial [Clostridiales bacterium]|nr:hypothetical protein [Clostridiales bacterium]